MSARSGNSTAREKRMELIRIYASQGKTVEWICQPHVLNLDPEQVEKLAARAGVYLQRERSP